MVEVRQTTLSSRVAVEKEEERRGEEEERRREARSLKSNNPHLAGGEKNI